MKTLRKTVSLVALSCTALLTLAVSSSSYACFSCCNKCNTLEHVKVTPTQQICFNSCYSQCNLSGNYSTKFCNPACAKRMLRGDCNFAVR